MYTLRSAVILVVLVSACAQYAQRPPGDVLTPTEWTPTISGPAKTAPSEVVKGGQAPTSTVEERLRAVSHLQEQGLITADEAKKKRQQILGDL